MKKRKKANSSKRPSLGVTDLAPKEPDKLKAGLMNSVQKKLDDTIGGTMQKIG
jgi:hypothetical protein